MNAGLARGTHHWNWETFREGMEYTVGGIAWARFGAGVGYSPYKLKPSTLEEFSNKIPFEDQGSAKIFRERFQGKTDVGTFRGRQTSPWQEHFNLGQYHERVIAITQDGKVFFNEFYSGVEHGVENNLSKYISQAAGRRSEFAYVGVKNEFNGNVFRILNPRSLAAHSEYDSGNFVEGSARYNRYRNNCQGHAAAVREALGF
jgi:hypothetical protein